MINFIRKSINSFKSARGISRGDLMSSEDMNQILGDLAERDEYLKTVGIAPHDSGLTYPANSVVVYNNKFYKAKTENINRPPANCPNEWEECPIGAGELFNRFVSRDGTGLFNTLLVKNGGLGIASVIDPDTGLRWTSDGILEFIRDGQLVTRFDHDNTTFYFGANRQKRLILQKDGTACIYDGNDAKQWLGSDHGFFALGPIGSAAGFNAPTLHAKQTLVLSNRANESEQYHVFSDNSFDLKFWSSVTGQVASTLNRDGAWWSKQYGWFHDAFASKNATYNKQETYSKPETYSKQEVNDNFIQLAPKAINNWDVAIKNGFYYSLQNAVVNSPDNTKHWNGIIVQHNDIWVTQEIWAFTEDSELDTKRFRRDGNGNSQGQIIWSTWARIRSTEREIDDRIKRPNGALLAKPGAITPNNAQNVGYAFDTDPDSGLGLLSDGVLGLFSNGMIRAQYDSNGWHFFTGYLAGNLAPYRIDLQTDGNVVVRNNQTGVVLRHMFDSFTQSEADNRFINASGDSMTGVLRASMGMGLNAGIKGSNDGDTGFEWAADGNLRTILNAQTVIEHSGGGSDYRFGTNKQKKLSLQNDGTAVIYGADGNPKQVLGNDNGFWCEGNIQTPNRMIAADLQARSTVIISSRTDESKQWHLHDNGNSNKRAQFLLPNRRQKRNGFTREWADLVRQLWVVA